MGLNVEDAFTNELLREIRERKENIASGRCETYDEYRAQCGVVEGLTRALNQLEALTPDDPDAD